MSAGVLLMMITVAGVVLRTGRRFTQRYEWLVAGRQGDYVWHGYTMTRRAAQKAIDRTVYGDRR